MATGSDSRRIWAVEGQRPDLDQRKGAFALAIWPVAQLLFGGEG